MVGVIEPNFIDKALPEGAPSGASFIDRGHFNTLDVIHVVDRDSGALQIEDQLLTDHFSSEPHLRYDERASGGVLPQLKLHERQPGALTSEMISDGI